MKKYLSRVRDMYGLSGRIKKINKNYELVFNYKSKKYEVHDFSNHVCSLCLQIEPNELDSRILRKLVLTRRENMARLFKSIDEQNKKMQEQNIGELKNQCGELFEDVMGYACRTSRELEAEDIKKIITNIQGEKTYA